MFRSSFEEVIRPPFDRIDGILELSSSAELLLIKKRRPCKRRDCEGHRKSVLDIISGVVVSSGEINLEPYITLINS